MSTKNETISNLIKNLDKSIIKEFRDIIFREIHMKKTLNEETKELELLDNYFRRCKYGKNNKQKENTN